MSIMQRRSANDATTVIPLLVRVLIGVLAIFLLTGMLMSFYSYIVSDDNHVIIDVNHMISQCACEWQPGVNVFNLGFPKGGSSTLHALMKQIGCKSSHQGVSKNMTRLREANVSASWADSGNLMKKAYWEGKPLLHFIDDSFNAFMQMDFDFPPNHVFPQLEYYELLQQQYPKSKFILMKRNVTDHIRSINKWSDMRHRMRDFDLPYFPKGKGTTDQEMRIWIEGHYDRVIRYFNAVAPDQFLVVQLEDKPVEAIAEFLHCTGNYTMPHANRHATPKK